MFSYEELTYQLVHQSDNVALTFYLFSSPDAVERDRMHFTPKTYYYLASNFSA